MKSFKVFAFAACVLAGLAFTSCNDDDDNNTLSPQERQEAFQKVKGNYTGELVYASVNPKDSKDQADTVSVSWQIGTDSVMTIQNIPAIAVARNITDTIIRKAVAAQPAQDMKCYIGFFGLTPPRFLVNPTGLTYEVSYSSKLGEEPKMHKVQVLFLANNMYSQGYYEQDKNRLTMQLIEAAIYVDGTYQSGLLSQSYGLRFQGKR